MTEILSAVEVAVLTGGIRFLYSQAGEILKRWREVQNKREEGITPVNLVETVDINLPPVFEGNLSEAKIHFDTVEKLEKELRESRRELSDYADGIENVTKDDEILLQKVDALRKLLEKVFEENINFKGEERLPSELTVKSAVNVDSVEGGEVIGNELGEMELGEMDRGNIESEVNTKSVKGGKIIGNKIDKIG